MVGTLKAGTEIYAYVFNAEQVSHVISGASALTAKISSCFASSAALIKPLIGQISSKSS